MKKINKGILFIDNFIHFISKNIKTRLWFFYKEINTSYDKDNIFCNIDLIVTLIDKDIIIAEKTLESVRSHSLNKVRYIFIIAPDTIKIREFCNKHNCNFINEDLVSPFTSQELVNKGITKSRVGWIKQQLIKLNSDNLSSILDRYLIIDADTFLLKNQFFSINNRDVLKFSDEFHFLYKKSCSILLGKYFYSFKSFISHHQLVQKNILTEMKSHISRLHQKEWYDVFIEVAMTNSNYVSEYELYAQFCIQNKKRNFKQQYWFNINSKIYNYRKSQKIHPKAQSISYHNYQN